MNEFDLAWTILKGLPEQQMFIEDSTPPKMMNQNRRISRLGTVNPAIEGMLSREWSHHPDWGDKRPNLRINSEAAPNYKGDSLLDWTHSIIDGSQGLHEKWYPGKKRGAWGTEGEDVAYDDTPRRNSTQDIINQYDPKKHGNDIDQYMAENDPSTRRKLEEEEETRKRGEQETQDNFKNLLQEYEPEQFLDHPDGLTPIQRQRSRLEDMARELAMARGMPDPRSGGAF
jgi:hypothetical protein